jgi:hypothetical protein
MKRVPDYILLWCKFLIKRFEFLNLKYPQNFNQKIQWIKVYDRNPLYTKLADKYAVREYVTEKVGGKYLIPLLWVGTSFDDINFDIMPNQFVIKCNHGFGRVVVCKDKSQFDVKKAKRIIDYAMRQDYYLGYPDRQWQYKDIQRKIIIEEYLFEPNGEEISDYKIYCFNGEPKYIGVFSERFKGNIQASHFDLDWNLMPFSTRRNPKIQEVLPKRPTNLEEMISISNYLSKDAHFVRVDLYSVNDKIFLGELTLTPKNGHYMFQPKEWNKIFGDLLSLPYK